MGHSLRHWKSQKIQSEKMCEEGYGIELPRCWSEKGSAEGDHVAADTEGWKRHGGKGK